MTQEFIPAQQALELKELGFDEPCFGYYEPNGNFGYVESHIIKDMPFLAKNSEWQDLCSAPTFSQAFRWFRENCGWPIETWIQPYLSTNSRTYEGLYWRRGETKSIGIYDTYEEAELECLTKLIEIVKEKL